MINNEPHCDLRRKEDDTESMDYRDYYRKLNLDYKNSLISLSVLAVFILSIFVAM